MAAMIRRGGVEGAALAAVALMLACGFAVDALVGLVLP